MGSQRDPSKITVDFTDLQSIGAVVINRWAHKNHISARRKLAEQQDVALCTVDGWIQGKQPIPQNRLARMIVDLDESFATEFVRELARQGKFSWLARIFRQHISRILEDTDAPRTRNSNGRCAHVGNNCSSNCDLDRVGRPLKS